MKYIILAAGKGSRLHPLTLNHPKSLFKLDKHTTLLQHMVELIREYDQQADIVVITGHMHKCIEENVEDVTFIFNPFYAVTNSIASLWFAKEHLICGEPVIIFDGDIVTSKELMEKVVCVKPEKPTVLLDSSIKTDGDYNVEVVGNRVLVMNKNLNSYYGEYAGISKLDSHSAALLNMEMEEMIQQGAYDQWYENALVQMIFKDDFRLYFEDIKDYSWTEVDCINDLLLAKNIYLKDKEV